MALGLINELYLFFSLRSTVKTLVQFNQDTNCIVLICSRFSSVQPDSEFLYTEKKQKEYNALLCSYTKFHTVSLTGCCFYFILKYIISDMRTGYIDIFLFVWVRLVPGGFLTIHHNF